MTGSVATRVSNVRGRKPENGAGVAVRVAVGVRVAVTVPMSAVGTAVQRANAVLVAAANRCAVCWSGIAVADGDAVAVGLAVAVGNPVAAAAVAVISANNAVCVARATIAAAVAVRRIAVAVSRASWVRSAGGRVGVGVVRIRTVMVFGKSAQAAYVGLVLHALSGYPIQSFMTPNDTVYVPGFVKRTPPLMTRVCPAARGVAPMLQRHG